MASNSTQAFFTMLGKCDGRDKFLATLQYAAMFAGAGEKGSNFTLVQKSLGAARKPFRFIKPVETAYPLIKGAASVTQGPAHMTLLAKLKVIGMVLYFGGDNIVWASQAGIIKNKKLAERVQKVSWYGWLLGSTTTIITEILKISEGLNGVDKEADKEERKAKRAALNKRYIVLLHALTQAALAIGLLQVLPFKPRVTGTFGVLTSFLACYQLMPALEKPKIK